MEKSRKIEPEVDFGSIFDGFCWLSPLLARDSFDFCVNMHIIRWKNV